MRRTTITMLAAGLAATCVTGCFNPFRPLVGTAPAVAEKPPAPTSAAGVLNLLRWCWINRRIAEYEELFTDDFQFAFSDVEAVDNLPIPRQEEIDIARRLFVDGSPAEPRAKRIDLDFSSTLQAIPDQRPGKTSPWHKQINTGVVLRAELAEDVWLVQGDVTFYLTRGDSAVIPTALLDRGFTQDYKRWYIERWEDKTSSGGGGASLVVHLLDRARAGSADTSPRARLVTSRSSPLTATPSAPAWGAARSATPLAATSSTPARGAEIRVSWGGLKSQFR